MAGRLGDPASIVKDALELELQAGDVVADELEARRCVFLAGLYRAGQAIADRLGRLRRTRSLGLNRSREGHPWVEARAGITLAEVSGQHSARLAFEGPRDYRRPGVGRPR